MFRRHLAILLFVPVLLAQGTPSLLKDIATGTAFDFGCTPGKGVTLGGYVYFDADGNGLGRELFRTDGTPGGTTCVKDIAVGGSAGAKVHTLWNGKVLFSANDGSGATEWSSDGTATGTQSIGIPGFQAFTVWNGFLWYGNGAELRRTDGTLAGTTIIRTLNHPIGAITASGNQLFVTAQPSSGTWLWVSDGSTAGTNIINYYGNGGISQMLPVNGNAIVFPWSDGVFGTELWRSDGTYSGTTLLLDLAPGAASGNPQGAVVWNSAVWFSASNGSQVELWKCDGTPGGTVMFDVSPGPFGSQPTQLTPAGARMYFVATDILGTGTEVYRTDGTPGGTLPVADINPGNASSQAQNLLWDGTWLWFGATNGSSGQELWRTNVATTQLAADIWPGPNSSVPQPLGFAGSNCICSASNASYSGELFASNGAGATFLRDVYTNYPVGSYPSKFTQLPNDRFWFAASTPATGTEPHLSDGTTAGTTLIADVIGGSSPSIAFPSEVTEHLGYVYWSGNVLYRTDGTAPGTTAVGTLNMYDLRRFANRVFHVGYEPAVQNEVFFFENPLQPRVLLKDIAPGTLGNAANQFTVVGNRMFFVASDGTGAELWVTDGTTAGTVQVVDLSPAYTNLGPSLLTAVGRKLYFRGPFNNDGLWVTDGTAGGTAQIAGHVPAAMVASGERLFFVSFDGGSLGTELWVANGTTATLCRDIRSGAVGSDPHNLTAFGNGVLFFANDGSNGSELWQSDGTLGGTTLVKNIGPGSQSGVGYWLYAPVGAERALFAGSDGSSGLEVWRTDGTAAGTVLHAELEPGFDGSYPDNGRRVGNKLVLAAQTLAVGREPFILSTMACCEPIGTACGLGLPTAPIASGVGAPRLGNAAFATRISAGPGMAALFVLGDLVEAPVGSCDIRVANFTGQVVVITDAQGAASVPIPVPNTASLNGLRFAGQFATLENGGPFLGSFSVSNGLELVLATN